MSKYGDIIAIGGGGFGRNPEDRTIEQYILEQSSSSRPRIFFFPMASAENSDYITNYYRAFSKLDCKPTDISLFSRTPNLEACIRESDIIYIGGGNTKSMLSVFDMINTNKISSCYAIEDGAALHYRNNKLLDAVSFYKGSKAFQLYKENNQIIESSMEMINLY